MAVAGNFRAFFIFLGQKSLYFPPPPHFYGTRPPSIQRFLYFSIMEDISETIVETRFFGIDSITCLDYLNIFRSPLLDRENFEENFIVHERLFPRLLIPPFVPSSSSGGELVPSVESSPEYSTSARKTRRGRTETSDGT